MASASKAYKAWSALSGHARARHIYSIARHVQKHSRLISVIEALDNDKDVFEYKSDTYSHPLLGKVVSIISSSEYQTLTTHCAVHGWL